MRHKSYLISRIIGNAFTPVIAGRLEHLNALYFKKRIKKVTLRNNATNWGSCSYDGHISISSRLLFAPPEVVDYILIHELAHLVEHNHSDRFWRLVESVMPAYKKAEKWLEVNGNQCMF
ncbi:MAG: M48 family metallopeptidase [Chitinophagales bacterium]